LIIACGFLSFIVYKKFGAQLLQFNQINLRRSTSQNLLENEEVENREKPVEESFQESPKYIEPITDGKYKNFQNKFSYTPMTEES
jgi:hypothetical protein